MLFTFVAGLVACQSMALRPDMKRAGRANQIAELGNLVKGISNPKESMPVLRAAKGIVENILAQNATEHMSDEDEALLREVVDMIEVSVYASMDSAHAADEHELTAAAQDVANCNADIAARQAPGGDLGKLHQKTLDKQTELNRLQGEVDAAIITNATEWATFDDYMSMIANPPACPDFPARTKPNLDVYFEKSDYSAWFGVQQGQYEVARQKYLDADAALQAALQAFNLQRALRDTQYCDWKSELEAACARFDTCYAEKSDLYTKIIVPRIQSDMNARIEIFKAGETLIHQVTFLLGESTTQETPAIDTGRYELVFPELDPKGECDLEILGASTWVPTVSCEVEYTECPGLHETTCGTNLNWHAEVGVRTDASKRCIPGYANTKGGNCKTWCGDRGFECLRAQDSHQGRCNLWPEHTRQTTAENGCLQNWADQVCECGLTGPAERTFPSPAVIKNVFSKRRLFAQANKNGESGVGAMLDGPIHADQKWNIESLGDGMYKVQNFHSGRRLFAQVDKNGESGVGAMSDGPLHEDQKWFIEDLGDGRNVFRNVHNGRRLFGQDDKAGTKSFNGEVGVGAMSSGPVWEDQEWLIEAAP